MWLCYERRDEMKPKNPTIGMAVLVAVVGLVIHGGICLAAGPEIEMVLVKGGCFQMGDTFGDGATDEKPVHEVCVDDFHIGKYEVTQAQWEAVMGANPSEFKKGGEYPVEFVSWNDVQDFIGKLNAMTGRRYRLPTEAEWEYAARSGGKKEKYAGTSDEGSLGGFAWYDSNSRSATHPFGLKTANSLGIYDMSGNVWEWVQDWYGEYYYKNSPRENPQGPSRGDKKVFRGGSWKYYEWYVRTPYRDRNEPTFRDSLHGFRLAAPSR